MAPDAKPGDPCVLVIFGGAGDLELYLRDRTSARAAGHVADVGVVPEDDLGDPVQDPRLIATLDQQTDRLSHGRER